MKILIVDDDPYEVKRLQALVEEYGHQVYTASTGAQALSVLAAEQPDWMILDTGLPDMSGLDVLRQIRLNPDTRQVGVVLVNPNPNDEEVVFGFTYFSDAHWQHPVDANALRRLLALCAEGPDTAEGELEKARFVQDMWSDKWDAEAKRDESYSLERTLDRIRQHGKASP